MGTRPVQGLEVLCLLLLSAILIQSCYKEPKPIAIDITKPTMQEPPAELWRKRVVTKPPSEAKRHKIWENEDFKASLDELAKVEGWTLARSPILLAGGDVLCVTSNKSIDTGGTGRPDWAGASTLYDKHTMYRLVIVSDKGKIKLHKEFRWDEGASLVPDPTGEYLAFVAQDTYSPFYRQNDEESGEKTISALDFELNVVWKYEVESANIRTSSFAVSDRMMVWESRDIIEDASPMTYACKLTSMNRDGSLAWRYELPDMELMLTSNMFNHFSVDSDGNLYLCNSDQNIYHFSADGKLVWKTFLDYAFRTHPVLLPGGSLVMVGDERHKVKIPDFEPKLPDLDASGMESFTPPDQEQLEREHNKLMREVENFQKELFSLKGYLFVLSNEGEVITEKQLASFPNSEPVVIDTTKLLLNISDKINLPPILDPTELQDISSRLMCVTTEGKTLWDKAFDTQFLEGGIIVADHPGGDGKCITAAGADGNLYCLDEAGELLWVISGTDIDPISLAVGSDGLIYVVADGELVCYQMK